MAFFGIGRRRPGPVSAVAESELFDEAFQKRLESLALVSRRVMSGRQRADRRSRKSGTGLEFADYRRYSAGDDIRFIDWNAYGRLGRLLLRLYEEEEDLSVYLLLDCSASMGFGSPPKLRYAKQLCAALAYIALASLDRVSILAFRENLVRRLPPTRGRNRIFAVFEFLRSLNAEGQTRLSDSLATFTAQHKRRGVAIVLSDLFDPDGFEQGINKLRYQRFETFVIHLVDPLEARPDLHGDVELLDSETGQRRDVTATPALLARYQEAYAGYQQRLQAFCTQKQIPLFTLQTDVPLEDAVLRILRRGWVLS